MAAIDLLDACRLPADGGDRHVLAVTRVSFANAAPPESYLLPLVADRDGLREAHPGDGTWAAVAAAVVAGLHFAGSSGLFAFEPEAAAAAVAAPDAILALRIDGDAPPRARAADSPADAGEVALGDQTHSSAVVGGSQVVKLLRRLGPGGSRELAVGRLLARAPTFDGTPALVGSVVHRDPAGTIRVLAIVHAFVPDAADGYETVNEGIRAWLTAPDAARLRASTDAAAALGTLTARLHAHLAGSPRDVGRGRSGIRSDAGAAATPSRVASAADRHAYRAAGERSLTDAIAATRASAGPGSDRLAAWLVGVTPLLARRLALLEDPGVPIAASLGHGDLHLGQTLVTRDDTWFLIDFEGEPLGAADEPGHEPPAIRDVAAMLRSFDHVARSAARRVAAARRDDPALDPAGDPIAVLEAVPPDLRAAVDRWIAAARRRYLAAYRAGAGFELRLATSARGIHAFEVEKECYELGYATRVLPTWTWAPVGGIAWLLAHPPRQVTAAAGAAGHRAGARARRAGGIAR